MNVTVSQILMSYCRFEANKTEIWLNSSFAGSKSISYHTHVRMELNGLRTIGLRS